MKTQKLLITIMLFFSFVAIKAQDKPIKPSFMGKGVFLGETPPLRDLPKLTEAEVEFMKEKALQKAANKKIEPRLYPYSETALPKGPDALWQKSMGKSSASKAPLVNFEGQTTTSFPPDCNGTVGPNHFMQTVNVTYSIYNKSGTLLAGPTALNTLFTGVPGATQNDGDPIVLYDEQADRWLVAEFTYNLSNDYMLVAVSTTNDPTGTWYKYSFDVTDDPDYPKFGIWQDGYYMGINNTSSNDIYVFERSKMLLGQTAQMVAFDNAWRPGTGFLCVPPLDNDKTFAPIGSPGLFIAFNDDAVAGGLDQLWMYELAVNWTNTASSTFNRVQQIGVTAFDSKFNASWNDITQPTSQKLDGVPQVIMNAPQYRNFGTYQTIVCCHTVDVSNSDHSGIRWYELRKTPPSTTWVVRQQGTYCPDTNSRWMGSIMLNGSGKIGLAYSISSSTIYPGIRYCGQSAAAYASASGVMDIPEAVIQNGTVAQTTYNRWGDYALLSVDPTDDETFWFTSEYVKTGGSTKGTKIASFRFGNNPIVTTNAATSILSTTATLNGSVNPNSLATTYYFEYGLTTSYGTTTTTSSAGSGTSAVAVLANLTGLSAGQIYHFRIVATNSDGTSSGNDLTFTTSGAAILTTTAATSITQNTATSGGNITSDGGTAVTARGVCWSTTLNPTIADSHLSNGTGTGTFSISITGLLPITLYHIRAYATNANGTFYGNDLTFTTLGAATLTTTAASIIAMNTATSGGNITSDGGSAVTARGVCWATTANPVATGLHTTDGSGTGVFSSSITGLSGSTLYHVRAYATNANGTFYGNDITFTTLCGNITAFPWNEGFENAGSIPNCWTQEQVSSSGINWTFITGNGSSYPSAAHGGTYNACLKDASTADNKTKLITPSLNLSTVASPRLRFWHTQQYWSPDQDTLIVFYKTSAAGIWTQLVKYSNSISTWTKDSINLPNSSSDYYVAFEGNAKYGYGVCVDDVSIIGTASSNSITTGTITGSPFCAGGSISVPYTISGTFTAGNIFTAQLSDATGAFASPVTIGTLTSISAGTISGTISTSTVSGTAYRVRVVGSTPATTGTANSANLTINATAAPTGTASQSFCNSATVANLQATGTGILWYAASSGGTALSTSTSLVNGNHYYASQTIGGCESAGRFDVTVAINVPSAPTGTASQVFCNASTVADLQATGTGILWYAASSGGTALSTATSLVNGNHYYASQTVSGCESIGRFDVTVTVYNSSTLIPPSIGTITQPTCSIATASVILNGLPATGNWTLTKYPGGTTTVGTGTTTTISGLVTGTYNYTVTNAVGCTSEASADIVIIQQPHVPVTPGTISGLTTVCQGQDSIVYTVPVIGLATSYVWTLLSGATGTSSTNSIVVNYSTSATTGNITVNGNNICGDGPVSSLPVTVNRLPTNAGAISGDTDVCQGQNSVNYSVPTMAYATSYVWTLPMGATGSSTTRNITVNYGTSAVSGDIIVKGHNACGDGVSRTQAVTVNPLPSDAGIISGTAGVCQGQNQVNYTVPAIPNATSYVWTLPSGATGNSSTNSINVNFGPGAASGNIIVNGNNSCGDGNLSTLGIIVYPGYTFIEYGSICNGTSLNWQGANYTTEGTYTANHTSINGCDSNYTLHLAVKPTYTFTETHDICDGETYLWRGQNLTSGGIYYDNLKTTESCDSIYSLSLMVNPVYNITETHSVCMGDTYVWHGQTLTTAGTYTASYQTIHGCDSIYTLHFIINPAQRTLEVKVFLEGLYSGSGLMNQAQGITGSQFDVNIADRVKVELHDAISPFTIKYEESNVNLFTNGMLTISALPCDISGLNYVVIKHRNSIETWSNSPVDFNAASPVTYDFTSAASKAYGNNQAVFGIVYALWGGDYNQDGVVDGSDMAAVDNSSTPPSLAGYNPEDINGDGIVDGSDMAIIDNNSSYPTVQVKRP